MLSAARWFSVSATRHARQPVVRAVKVTHEFDPEFQINKEKADTMLPWVPRKERGAARRALQRQLHREQLQSDLTTLKSQLAEKEPAILRSTFEQNVNEPQRPEPHPDSMVDYKQQFEYQCQLYQYELAQKQQAKVEMEVKSVKSQVSLDLEKAEQEEQDHQIQEAVAALEDFSTRAFKRDKVLKIQQGKMEERKKALLRLYKVSHSFITADRLDEALEAFFAEEKKTQSLPLHKMHELAMESRRLKREAVITDELSGGFDRSAQTVEELEQRRAAERAALQK